VRDPALRFITDIGPGLRKLSPQLRADAKLVGGSLFRINRDIRFSADKSPYKTNLGIGFGHTRGRETAAPGLRRATTRTILSSKSSSARSSPGT
jgi:uncharacterized protein (DUF2461 family)